MTSQPFLSRPFFRESFHTFAEFGEQITLRLRTPLGVYGLFHGMISCLNSLECIWSIAS